MLKTRGLLQCKVKGLHLQLLTSYLAMKTLLESIKQIMSSRKMDKRDDRR